MIRHCANLPDNVTQSMIDVLTAKGGSPESKLDAMAVAFFAMDDMNTKNDNVSHVLEMAGAVLRYAVSKLSGGGPGWRGIFQRLEKKSSWDKP